MTVTASLYVHVIEIASPTPYAESVASQPVMSGELASMTTSPKSPDAAAAAPPAASAIVPLYDDTARLLVSPLPSATT